MEESKTKYIQDIFHVRTYIKNNMLMILTVLSVIIGLVLGITLRNLDLSVEAKSLIQFPGDLFMNMLKVIILPLIVSSLVSGLARLDPKTSGSIGKWAVIYYLATTVLAVITGIILILIMQPGGSTLKSDKTGGGGSKPKTPETSTLDAILDLFRNLIPENLVRAAFQSQKTSLVKNVVEQGMGVVNRSNNALPVITYTKKIGYEDSMNAIGIIAVSLVFGMVLGRMGEASHAVVVLFEIANDIVMKLVSWVMWYSPIGIMCLIAGKVLSMNDLYQSAQQLGIYMLTVILGLILHVFCTLPLIYFLITRKNPYIFMKGMLQAILTAMATASSAATLPFTFQCAEENNHVDPRITRFILPIGATINMDGTALYEAVAAIFIAGINNVSLGIGGILTVSVTATVASIGAASIPGAGLITMVLVLNAVNLPSSDIAILLPVDWLLDRFRTTVNVLGDAYGAGIVDHICKEDLKKHDEEVQGKQVTTLSITSENESVDMDIKTTK